MPRLNPWKHGAVLSLTVVIGYLLCALFWFALPAPSITLINGLFHGMDFRKLQAATEFSIGTLAFVLVVLAVWSYILGALYAGVRNMVMADRSS